ncbi:MAG: NAD-dependent epimerase/dehydratase family protein [Nitrospira sp.]|nr:NAD-dependent epimerase/dehydratase family protein [Nitrospira sp.]
MTSFETLKQQLPPAPRRWLITGVAGFIGSNLLEFLLESGQLVVGLDNFSTGHRRNLEDVQRCVGADRWARFTFIEGDIANPADCAKACVDVEYVLHEAALGSVPRSIADPQSTNRSNVDGFLNMLVAARDAKVKRFVYASSSSVYGDHPGLPKVEDVIGRPLSPYAVTKYLNELYAEVFARTYAIACIGLRYFNVFGPRQNQDGPYAAVIPAWVTNLVKDRPCVINGDGETSRDFCYIDNVLQANILAATTENANALNRVYNIAIGKRTRLIDLFLMIRDRVATIRPAVKDVGPQFGPFRPGDVRHSLANIDLAKRELRYEPTSSVTQGLAEAVPWYVTDFGG